MTEAQKVGDLKAQLERKERCLAILENPTSTKLKSGTRNNEIVKGNLRIEIQTIKQTLGI